LPEKLFSVSLTDRQDGYEERQTGLRGGRRLTEKDALKYVKFLCAEAHKYCMACSLKNALDLVVPLGNTVQYYVNEECVVNGECNKYNPVGGKKPIYHVEYDKRLSSIDGGKSGGRSSDRKSGGSFGNSWGGLFGGRGSRLSRRAEQAQEPRFCPRISGMHSLLADKDLTGVVETCDRKRVVTRVIKIR
jgi:hypothetical protein